MGSLQRKQRAVAFILAVPLGCVLLLAAQVQAAFPEDVAAMLQASSEYAGNLAKLQDNYVLIQSNTNPSTTEPAAIESQQADIAYRRDRGELPDPTRQLRANPINQYNDNVCGLQDIIVPTSTREVAAAVRYYYSLVRPYGPNWRDVKLRVASRIKDIPIAGRTNLGFGESAGFACPRGDSPAARTAVITTNNMRSVLDREGTFVTVQAGMTMSDLIAYANSQQLTIPLGIVPGYTDLSVGGLLSTGGHANGPKGANALADITVSVTFVDGTGEIHTVDRDCYEGRGLMGGLGMLGVITEVTLKLQPGLGKSRVFAIGPKPDDNIETELDSLLDTYDSRVFMFWRPDQRRVKYFVWQEVDPSTPSNPPETFAPTIGGPIRPLPNSDLAMLAGGIAALTLDLVNQTEALDICTTTAYFVLDQKWNVVNGTTLQDDATALTNNVQGTDCNSNPAAGSCFFDLAPFAQINAQELAQNVSLDRLTPSFTYEENEFAIRRQHLRSALADIKALARNGFGAPCWPPGIIYARAGGPTPDWISPVSGGPHEQFVWMELAMFRSNIPAPVALANPRVQKKLPGLQEAFEQLMVCKYGGRPHWGKSFERLFTSEACPIRDLYPHMHKQLHLKSQYDPAKLFETELIRAMLSGGDETHFPACSNEMKCYCKTDLDCGSPGKLSCRTAPAPLPPYKICVP